MSKKVLFADDNIVLANAVEEILVMLDFEVTILHSGKNVENEIKSGNYDILVTDIVMPDVEGLETIMNVRKFDKTIPILVITGDQANFLDNNTKMAQSFGANDILIKPFELTSLIEKINFLIN